MWYFSIIDRALARSIDPGMYYEKHHIVPKSLGGDNKKSNIVTLTAKEHFVCHRLLVKMTTGKDKLKMSYAIRCMMKLENEYQVRYKISAKTYETIRRDTRSVISSAMSGENNPFFNKEHSIQTREKMSELRNARKAEGIVEGMKDKHHTDATKQKLREANERQFNDPWQIEIRRIKNKIQMSDPARRMAAGNGKRGKHWYHDPITKESKLCFENEKPQNYIKGRIMNDESGKGA